MESVIFQYPALLLLYGAALFFCLYDRVYRTSGPWFSQLSTALALAASACSLVCGASIREIVTVLLVFLLLNMGGHL